jgi:hypothetical protein
MVPSTKVVLLTTSQLYPMAGADVNPCARSGHPKHHQNFHRAVFHLAQRAHAHEAS